MDETTLLRQLGDRAPEPTETALHGARTALHVRIAWATTEGARRPTPRRRISRRTAFLGVGVAAATCTAVAVAVVAPTPAPTASAGAVRMLRSAATAIRTAPVTVGANRTHHLQLVSGSSGAMLSADEIAMDSSALSDDTVVLRTVGDGEWERTWSASRIVGTWGPAGERIGKDVLDDPTDSTTWTQRSAADPNFWTGPTSLSPAKVRAMPRDPATLLRTLNGGTGDPDDRLVASTNRVIDAASALLGSGLADAELQAVTYQALERLPGLLVDEHGRDIDGRAGVAIGAEVSGGRQRIDLIIDPGTGRFLGRTETNLTASAGAPAGTVEEASAVYQR